MATHKSKPAPTIPRDIEAMLRSLRRRIRFYVCTDGLAVLLIALGLAFWIGLAIDWTFEPSTTVRRIALATVLMLAAWIAFHFILRRTFARLANTSLAVILERYFPHFQDSLVTAVEMAEQPCHADPFNRQMLDDTGREALDKSADVQLQEVFNWHPLLRNTVLAAALIVSILGFALNSRQTFGFWVQRMAMSKELWPRTTRLVVDGFPPDAEGVRSVKVARDASLDIVVKADTRKEHIPDVVELRYRLVDGSRGRDTMTRIGRANPARDPFQLYRFTFENVATPLSFDVVGGDDRVEDLRIAVVERPQITEMTLHCVYPAYLQRPDQALTASGAMQIPEGTRLSIRGLTNKPLVRMEISGLESSHVIELADDRSDRQQFEFDIPPLSADVVLFFSLLDDDGITTLEPYRLALSVTPDAAPLVAVRLQGVGTAITPDARIRVIGKITDDHTVDQTWFLYQIGESTPRRKDFQPQPGRQATFRAEQVLDAREFSSEDKLQPKQRLSIIVQALDTYDLSDSSHVGASPRFVLDVVSPEQLRILLQRRELLLRQRFEAIYGDVTDTRDLMARIDFRIGSNSDLDSRESDADGPTSDADVAEPGDASVDRSGISDQRVLARRNLRITHALQSVERSAYETLGVAAGFDDIYDELVNNRLDTEELKIRLKDSIAEPLKHVGGQSLATLKNKVRELQSAADDLSTGPAALIGAVGQADTVLVEIKDILDKMLELESYNEVLELLRDIVEDQDELNDRTQQLRRQKLRELLEE